MRLLQYLQAGRILPGVLVGEFVVDLQEVLRALNYPTLDLPTLRYFIEAGEAVLQGVMDGLANSAVQSLPRLEIGEGAGQVRLAAPLHDARKLILLAGNYRAHIQEVGFLVPDVTEQVTPQFFMKPPSTTIIGPGEAVVIPAHGNWVDWEVELAVILGKKGKNIPESEAMNYVFGYSILNDISERAFNDDLPHRLLREKDPFMDWLHGKWGDTFAPFGPWIVTADEIMEPHNLEIALFLNGLPQQNANTRQMIHSIPYLIHKLSEIMTLEPGDILSTGTPAGVGHSKGKRLAAGDVIECRIESIGSLVNSVTTNQ